MKESLRANTTISHYRIVSKIGAGGMGEVYLAEDTKLRRKVALKLLSAELTRNEDRLRRFEQEAQAASALNHPNILTIYEIGLEGETHFIATEFIEGETLRDRVAKRKNTLEETLDVAVQTASALAAAHKAGIIHRDIKPENIMLREDGYAKVLDFGLAKLIEQQAPSTDTDAQTVARIDTDPGTVMGTVNYMSPEQAKGKPVDARTDVFSLGVVIYEMATGRTPFQGDSSTEVLAAILDREPPPLARFEPEAPAELQRIVSKTLRKNREERYQTIKDLLIDLKNLRDELNFEARLERSMSPESAARSGIMTISGAAPATASVSAVSSDAVAARTTSSAEYVVSEIKRHKRSALLVLLLLLVTLAALAYFSFFRSGSKSIDSIAVLPFTNTSGNTDSEYLSDGIAETLINSLSQLQQLRVVARSTAFRYKNKEVDPQQVGRDLNVRAVMTGRVRQLGDALSIQVDLVDATTGAQLWGEEYNRKISDILAVKQDISREITEKLRLKLTGEERKHLTGRETNNTEAYQSYLKGRYYWNKRTADGLKKAIGQFQLAIDRDPNYALAYVGIADSYLVLEQYAGTPASETGPKAKAAADRALQIDDSLAEAHTSLASYYHSAWQWKESEKAFKRSISLNPNYPTAHHWYQILLRAMGRLDEALAEIKRAQELDPLSPILEVNIASVYINKGDLDSAMEHAKRLVELDPNFSLAHEPLGTVYIKQRRYTEALAAFQQDVASDRTSYSLSNLGHAYAVAGRRDEAMAVLKELEGKYHRREALGQYLAAVYAGLDDKDQAFAWLEKDFQAHSGTLDFVTVKAGFDSLRSDPRYADLLRRMGLRP
ncbi:MAG: protein kinase [Acidobacteriota bacterium]